MRIHFFIFMIQCRYREIKMRYQLLKCSNCGSPLSINKSVKKCKCGYCGGVTVFENDISDEILDVHKLIIKTEQAEGDGYYDKAIQLYDKFLETEPENPYALLGRALASLSDTNRDVLNIDLFNKYFHKGLERLDNDKMNILDFLMYRFRACVKPFVWLWTNSDYEKLCSMDKKLARSQWLNNLMLLLKVQMTINELVENARLEKLSESYKEEYKDFKVSIVEFCKDLLIYRNKYGLKINFIDIRKIRKIIKTTKLQYKKFIKCYR